MLLIGIDGQLSCALLTSLAPWGLEVLSIDEESPGPSMPSTSVAAREVASRHDARVVVWLASDSDGHALWVYDAAGGQTVARPVSSPPFSASIAASLALSVKTTVRMVGLVEKPEPEAPPPASDPAVREAVPPASAPWQLGVRGGIRLGPFERVEPEARYAVELRYTQREPWWNSRVDLWGAIGLESGQWYDARARNFEGRIADPAASLTLGATLPIVGNLWLGVSEGVSLHYVRISGAFLREAARVTAHEFDATLDTRLALELALGSTRLVVSASGTYWTQWQAFEIVEAAEQPAIGAGEDAEGLAMGLDEAADRAEIRMRPFSAQLSFAVRVPLR